MQVEHLGYEQAVSHSRSDLSFGLVEDKMKLQPATRTLQPRVISSFDMEVFVVGNRPKRASTALTC